MILCRSHSSLVYSSVSGKPFIIAYFTEILQRCFHTWAKNTALSIQDIGRMLFIKVGAIRIPKAFSLLEAVNRPYAGDY